MALNLRIDGISDEPLYRQIVNAVNREVKAGTLPPGYKLPTVRELAEEMGISRGTIKHAYDQLEYMGVIKMTQGKGSFVAEREDEDAASRKERAMAAIDQLFSQLEELCFTPREMEIYINLKLRGLEEKYDVVKVAAIDCNPETLQLMEKQLSQIGYAETAIFALSQLPEVAAKLNADYDLILTTTTHYAQVEPLIQPSTTLGMMAMTPATRTVIRLAKLPEQAVVGIVCASDAFAGVVRMNCQGMGNWSDCMTTQLLGNYSRLRSFLKNKGAIILPEGYGAFASPEERELLASYEREGGQLIPYDYKIDRGSFLYVEEQIKKCINKKRSL